jgi:murein DD-endopeptidase MepM/ murein hydrolase activator NlpD
LVLLPLWSKWKMLRGRSRAVISVVTAFSVAMAGLAVASGAAAASVTTDQASIAQLEQQIAAEGARAQALVSRYNEVQAQVNALDAQIAHDERQVAADQRVEATALTTVRRIAVRAYTSGRGVDSPALAMFSGTSDITTMLQQDHYLGAVNNKWNDALTVLQLDQARTEDAQHGLQQHQSDAKKTLSNLASARDAATAAITADEAKLTGIKGNLRALLAAARAQHAADERAAEHALATANLSTPATVETPSAAPSTPAAPASTTSTAPDTTGSPPPAPPPVFTGPVPPPTSSGSYANPLRAITALTPERIDQGVDYAGFGPLYAIGNGVVLNTVGSGWPGGTFIAYQLTDGPAHGLVVFAAEDIQPSVDVGQTVTANTVIGQMYAGPTGIEMGWADGTALPDTMARRYGQYDGYRSSAFGYNFSQMLQSVGAPGGVLEGSPNGQLPPSWPRW